MYRYMYMYGVWGTNTCYTFICFITSIVSVFQTALAPLLQLFPLCGRPLVTHLQP